MGLFDLFSSSSSSSTTTKNSDERFAAEGGALAVRSEKGDVEINVASEDALMLAGKAVEGIALLAEKQIGLARQGGDLAGEAAETVARSEGAPNLQPILLAAAAVAGLAVIVRR